MFWIWSRWRTIVAAIATATALDLVFLTFTHTTTTAKNILSKLAGSLSWPKYAWGLLAILLISLFFLNGWKLLGRIFRSWRAELFHDLYWGWLVLTLVVYCLLEAGHAFWAASTLTVLLAFTVGLAYLRVTRRAGGDVQSTLSDPDVPILNQKDDRLNRDTTVATLLSILSREQPSVIALVAPYGDGKTSVLNMLAERLEQQYAGRFTVVRFSSWLPPDASAVILTLFQSIAEKLRATLLVPGMDDKMLSFARVITGSVPYLEGLKELFRDRSQAAQIARLTEFIVQVPSRIVVLIDDVDRMGFPELEVLFKSMRGISDMSNLSFVCAFEYDAVVKEIRSGQPGRDAERYVEKFFPIKVPLPKIETGALKLLFVEEVTRTAQEAQFLVTPEKQFSERLDTLWDKAISTYATNLRRLKLLLNKLRSMAAPIGLEIDFIDFVTLETLRDVSPQAYDLVYRYPRYFYRPDWALETWDQTIHPDRGERKIRLGKFYDQNLRNIDEGNVVLTLLGMLFPSVDEYATDRPGFASGHLTSEEAERDKRICHPRFFHQYFLLRVPEDYLSQREFIDFQRALSKLSDRSRVAELFESTYGSMLETTVKRWQFFRRVDVLASTVSESQLSGLAIGAAHSANLLTPDAFEWQNALSVIGTLVARFTERGTEFAAQLIRETTSDAFAAFIVGYFADENKPERNRQVEIEHLKRVLLERYREKYLRSDNPPRLFELGADQALRIMFAWSKWGGTDDIRKYLTGELERHSDTAVTLLSWMFPTQFFISNPNDFRAFLDYEDLLIRLKRLEADGKLTSEDRERLSGLKNLLRPPLAAAAGEE